MMDVCIQNDGKALDVDAVMLLMEMWGRNEKLISFMCIFCIRVFSSYIHMRVFRQAKRNINESEIDIHLHYLK